MRDVLFFIHIPKTAGTSINKMLARNLGSSLICIPHTFLEPPINSRLIKSWLNKSLTSYCVASHRLTIDIPLGPQDNFNGFAFAVIREPVEWFLSNFYYTRLQGIVSFGGSELVSSPAEYLDLIESRGKFLSQFRALTGESSDLGHVRQLIDQGKLCLIPQDNLELGLALLHYRFPRLLKDVSLEQLNINNSRPAYAVSQDFQEHFDKLFANDLELYQIAKESMQIELARHNPDKLKFLTNIFRLKSMVRSVLISPPQRIASRLNNAFQRL
jgi:hypothetical protein